MVQAKDGDTVKVHYDGTLEDGSTFDSSREKAPLEFTLGAGSVIPGFEKAVIGMNEGESKTVTVPPEEGYGEYMNEFVATVEKSRIPPNIDPEIGMVLQAAAQDGSVTNFTITAIDDNEVTLDGNHPLAGKNLTFDIELLEIT